MTTFKAQVSAALERIKTILEVERAPAEAGSVHHRYEDKYSLAEQVTRSGVGAVVNGLEELGVGPEQLAQLLGWARSRSVTLRMKAEERCEFVRKEKRKVDSATGETVVSTSAGASAKLKVKTVTTFRHFVWRFTADYEVFAFPGSALEQKLTLESRAGQQEVVTSVHQTPYPEVAVLPSLDLNITWLLQQIGDGANTCRFAIDRALPSCRTPRRNADVGAALEFFGRLTDWSQRVDRYFSADLYAKQYASMKLMIADRPILVNVHKHGLLKSPVASGWYCDGRRLKGACRSGFTDVTAINDASTDRFRCQECDFDLCLPCLMAHQADPCPFEKELEMSSLSAASIFVPVLPLFENSETRSTAERERVHQTGGLVQLAESGDDGGILLSLSDVNKFLLEQKRSTNEKLAELKKVFPTNVKLITYVEATVVTLMRHLAEICEYYRNSVDYIEQMLRRQLVAALGREVGALDFTNYMKFHNRKLYRAQFEMLPFCYAIRRPDHSPEGELSIETHPNDGNISEPIYTTVSATVAGGHAMQFALNAASQVTFHGERYLHAWVNQAFAGHSGASAVTLSARSRQFSGFIVLVGKIASATVFEPTHAVIVQNKDEVLIPLLLEQLPTPKEFRDAIESLSPEQQAFAKAFRAMQLESTLFGVCVIQIKPQLEKVLNLPNDSLTKEIKLTQDLLELFIKYQIPSHLLSFDGQDSASVADKLSRVKSCVAKTYAMVQSMRTTELSAATRTAASALLESPTGCSEMNAYEEQTLVLGDSLGGTTRSRRGVKAFFRGLITTEEASVPLPSMLWFKGGEGFDGEVYINNNNNNNNNNTITVRNGVPCLGSALPASTCRLDQFGSASSDQHATELQPTNAAGSISADHSLEPGHCCQDVDYTLIPQLLEQKYSELDEDNCLRPTIIKVGPDVSKRSQESLIERSTTTTSISLDQQKIEKDNAFDLLDALTKSGVVPIDHASFHIVIAATHCFDKTLIDTVVQDSINPIEKVERSALIVASVIHSKSPRELIKPDQLARVLQFSPALFIED